MHRSHLEILMEEIHKSLVNLPMATVDKGRRFCIEVFLEVVFLPEQIEILAS